MGGSRSFLVWVHDRQIWFLQYEEVLCVGRRCWRIVYIYTIGWQTFQDSKIHYLNYQYIQTIIGLCNLHTI